MIVFGLGNARLNSKQFPEEVCTKCEIKGSIVIDVISKHFHLFWIPMFPFVKTGRMVCGNCDESYDRRDFNENLEACYQTINEEQRAPWWQFSGLAVIAIIITVILVSSRQDNKMNLEYISNPAVGDVYELNTEDGQFTTLKVVEVLIDTVYFLNNDYYVNLKSGLYDLDIEENYDDTMYFLLQPELASMYEEDIIFNVRRD